MKRYEGSYKTPLNQLGLENRVEVALSRSREGLPVTPFFPGSEGKLFLIHSPDLIRIVLGKEHDIFVEDRHPFSHLGALFTPTGRGTLLMGPSLEADDSKIASEITAKYCAKLLAHRERAEIDVFPVFAKMTLEIMGRALFGVAFEELAERFFSASMQHEDFLAISRRGTPGLSEDAQRIKKSIQVALLAQEAVAFEIIEARRREGAEIPELPRGIPITRAVVRTLLNAYAGTATTLSWAAVQLARFPSYQQKLREEVLSAKSDADIVRLPGVANFLKETLRLFPTAWMMSRTCLKDTSLAGTFIPKGASLFICTYTLHRDPKLWPDSESFIPDRFLNGQFGDAPPYSYLPFGAGPHRCTGMRYAMDTLHIGLGGLLRSFEFSEIPNLTITAFPRVALQPEPGAWVKLTPIR